MEDLKVTAKETASGYDFSQAHAAMQRYVDGNILSGVSSAVLVGRELVDVNYAGWAGLLADTAPALPPVQIADLAGGSLFAVVEILAALLERQRMAP